MPQNFDQYEIKENDLVLTIQKSMLDGSLKGIMFLYGGKDGLLIIGKRAIELRPPINFYWLEMPQPKRLESTWEDGHFRVSSTAEEIYVGLKEVKRGLLSHPEFEAYGAVADYYARLQPKLSRFHD